MEPIDSKPLVRPLVESLRQSLSLSRPLYRTVSLPGPLYVSLFDSLYWPWEGEWIL